MVLMRALRRHSGWNMYSRNLFIDVDRPFARCRQTSYPKIIVSSYLGKWGTESGDSYLEVSSNVQSTIGLRYGGVSPGPPGSAGMNSTHLSIAHSVCPLSAWPWISLIWIALEQDLYLQAKRVKIEFSNWWEVCSGEYMSEVKVTRDAIGN